MELHRRLGTGDAVVIGLGSMLGAGVFATWGPAARAAGAGLLLGLALAAVVAYCNAVASAQLAAAYPVSGGTYVYGRERLGAWWGVAGWAFIIGKTASCTAMALTFASYAVTGPPWLHKVVAVGAVTGLAALNYRGVTRTALVTRLLVACTLAALTLLVLATLTSGAVRTGRLDGWWSGRGDGYGVLQAAGLLFFAFAGYARIATMGEEVNDPRTTIPRAIPVALLMAVLVYGVVGVSALLVAGPDLLAVSTSPLVDAAGRRPAGDRARRAARGLAGLAGRPTGADGRNRTDVVGDGPRATCRDGWVPCIHDFGCHTTPRCCWRPVLGAAGCLTLAVALPLGFIIAGAVSLAIGALGRLTVRKALRAAPSKAPTSR